VFDIHALASKNKQSAKPPQLDGNANNRCPRPCLELEFLKMLVALFSLALSSVLSRAEAGPVQKPFSLNRSVHATREGIVYVTNTLDRRTDGFPYALDEVDKLEEDALPKFQAYLAKKNVSSHGCTLENAARRKEWYEGTSWQAHLGC
jgi:hypothetical protein